MNKYLIITVLCCGIVSGCTKKREASVILKYTVINESQKLIIFSATTDVGYKEVEIKNNSVGEIEFIKKEKLKDDGGWTIYGGNGEPIHAMVDINLKISCIYNIFDTSRYCFEPHQQQYEPIDSMFLNGTDSKISGTAWNVIEHINITIQNNLLDIMCKDYSMLEKFPEYYSKK